MGIAGIHEDILKTHILTRLDGQTLAAAGCASSHLQSLCSDDKLWSHLCSATWPSTQHPLVAQSISNFTSGHRSFFSDAFATPSHGPTATATSSPPTSQIISAVDLRYGDQLVFSKVEFTETTPADDWFQTSPFRIDLLEYKELVQSELIVPGDDQVMQSNLEKHVTLSWIMIDPTRNRAVNVSSLKPVSVQRNWLTDEIELTFAVVTGDVNCNIEVTCGVKGRSLGFYVNGVSLTVQDIDGKCMNGKDSMVILQGLMVARRRWCGGGGGEGRREKYGEYVQRREERKAQMERRERRLDLVRVCCVVTFLMAFWSCNSHQKNPAVEVVKAIPSGFGSTSNVPKGDDTNKKEHVVLGSIPKQKIWQQKVTIGDSVNGASAGEYVGLNIAGSKAIVAAKLSNDMLASVDNFCTSMCLRVKNIHNMNNLHQLVSNEGFEDVAFRYLGGLWDEINDSENESDEVSDNESAANIEIEDANNANPPLNEPIKEEINKEDPCYMKDYLNNFEVGKSYSVSLSVPPGFERINKKCCNEEHDLDLDGDNAMSEVKKVNASYQGSSNAVNREDKGQNGDSVLNSVGLDSHSVEVDLDTMNNSAFENGLRDTVDKSHKDGEDIILIRLKDISISLVGTDEKSRNSYKKGGHFGKNLSILEELNKFIKIGMSMGMEMDGMKSDLKN
ncbi:hypothetical protein SSX86_006493 [Deinandra increscens subsp. villosa]|uniref:F-box domain-containing protein n=1 Tax=Deinandra increscens subsp. villosa TaxID=3103831 RepID=A0AAP0DMN0_9ASTR